MRIAFALVLVLSGCGGGLSLDDYPSAFRDAYCKYLTRCGSFPDVSTCQRATLGIDLRIDPSSQAEVDMGKVIFDGGLAQDCLDAFGSQTCDSTDEDGRAFFPAKCRDFIKGTVGAGGACADSNECKSQNCDVPTCTMACCQGTCMGDSLPPLGGAGDACSTSSSCAAGFYCDFNVQMCAELKPAGATCGSSNECGFDLGCAGPTGMRTCKALPTLGEACPDQVCRDAGTYCNSAGQCAKIGLAGASCDGMTNAQCSSFYPCDMATMKCTAAPDLGQPCTGRCFDADAFCDSSAAAPTCVKKHPDGAACMVRSECESNYCDESAGSGSGSGSGGTVSGTCGSEPVCI